jgi:hypothetical protein
MSFRAHPLPTAALVVGSMLVAVLLPLFLTNVLSVGHAFADTSASSSGEVPTTLSQGLADAVQQLRGSQDVQLSGTPSQGFGSVQGTDSSGSFLLYYNQMAVSAPITGVIVDTGAIAQAAASGTGIPTTQFVLDPSTFKIVSSSNSFHGILGGGTIEPEPGTTA